MNTNEREAFEAWATAILGDNPTWRESGDCELAWQAWQARASLSLPSSRDWWHDIATAPKNTEVIVWREDSGPFIAKLTTPDAVITVEEMEREGLEFPDDFEEWFSDACGWQEGSEKPTHWMPLPPAPAAMSQGSSTSHD